jgi:hypothetical protein
MALALLSLMLEMTSVHWARITASLIDVFKVFCKNFYAIFTIKIFRLMTIRLRKADVSWQRLFVARKRKTLPKTTTTNVHARQLPMRLPKQQESDPYLKFFRTMTLVRTLWSRQKLARIVKERLLLCFTTFKKSLPL